MDAWLFAGYTCTLIFAGIRDIRHKRINNGTCLYILLLSALCHTKINDALVGAILGILPLLVLIACRQSIGAGDIKFMMANGCLLGKGVLLASLIGIWISVASFFLQRTLGGKDKQHAMAPYLGTGCFICLVLLA